MSQVVQGPYIGADGRVKHMRLIGEEIPEQPIQGIIYGDIYLNLMVLFLQVISLVTTPELLVDLTRDCMGRYSFILHVKHNNEVNL